MQMIISVNSQRFPVVLNSIPVICHLCNTSLDCCRLPDDQKLAVMRPRLKKLTLDASKLNSYHPISNLSFLPKLVECIVTARYTTYA